MILIMFIIPLLINIVVSNSILTIDLIQFMNLQKVFNYGFILNSIPIEDVINFEYQGINEDLFEAAVESIIKLNIPNQEIVVSYIFFNFDNSWCDINNCDSVQFKVENNGGLVKINYEFSYSIKRNF